MSDHSQSLTFLNQTTARLTGPKLQIRSCDSTTLPNATLHSLHTTTLSFDSDKICCCPQHGLGRSLYYYLLTNFSQQFITSWKIQHVNCPISSCICVYLCRDRHTCMCTHTHTLTHVHTFFVKCLPSFLGTESLFVKV